MLKLAITGGIGSGKSYICDLFKSMGVPVFNSDNAARDLEQNPEIQKAFKEILGDDIYIGNELDRVKMRGIVFVDEVKLKKINNVVIPFIKNEFEAFIKANDKHPYCLFESAIIYETNSQSHFDKIITVSADMMTRMNRARKRDNSTIEEVNNKFRVQMTDQEKESRADFIINNSGHENVIEQVQKIHEELMGLIAVILNGTYN